MNNSSKNKTAKKAAVKKAAKTNANTKNTARPKKAALNNPTGSKPSVSVSVTPSAGSVGNKGCVGSSGGTPKTSPSVTPTNTRGNVGNTGSPGSGRKR